MGPQLIRNSLIWLTAFMLTAWIPAIAQGQINSIPVIPTQGILTNTADLLRGKNYAKVINNLHMTRQGVWTSRGSGWTRFYASKLTDDAGSLATPGTTGNSDIQEMHVHYGERNWVVPETAPNKPQSYLVMAIGTDVVCMRISGTTGTSPLVIGNNLLARTDDFQPCFRSYSTTLMVVTIPGSEPYSWGGNDAAAMAALAGWPITISGTQYSKPKYCELFATRVAYAGFPTKPSTVVLSKASTHNTFTVSSPTVATDAGAIDVPAALGPITGLKTIRIGNTTNDQILIVGCKRGVAFIGGTDATNFYMREYTRNHGVLSNRAWFQIQNDLYYPATDGLRTLASLNTQATLAPDTLTFGVNDIWQTYFVDADMIWFNALYAVHHPSTQEVWYFSPGTSQSSWPTSTTDRDKALVLNYNTPRNPDGTTAPIFSSNDGVTAYCGVDYEGSMLLGRSDGYIAFMYSGDDNNGSYIQWQFMPALIETNAQNPLMSSSSRRFVILTEGPDQAFKAEAYGLTTNSDGSSKWTNFFSQRLSQTSATITDLSTWATSTTTTYPHIIEFDPVGNARYWGIRLKAEQAGDHINLIGITQLQLIGGTRQ